jgi:hypothetical protein
VAIEKFSPEVTEITVPLPESDQTKTGNEETSDAEFSNEGSLEVNLDDLTDAVSQENPENITEEISIKNKVKTLSYNKN